MNGFEFGKYLRKNPAPALEPVRTPFAVVIPVLNESAEFHEVLASLSVASGGEATVVAVFNHGPATPPEWIADNRRLAAELRREPPRIPLRIVEVGELADGVGRARKLGFDAVLAAAPGPEHLPVLCSLDADSPVSPDYFTRLRAEFATHPEWGGAVLGVCHRAASPELERAIRCYEQYIFDYAARLRAIGSRYGYWAIGSAFAVRGDSYVRSGGMRPRTAGEDFYFLQALAKCAPIGRVETPLVFPAARLSTRVPFGTGPALEKLLHSGDSLPEFPPERFAMLKILLDRRERLDAADFFDGLPPELVAFLVQRGFPAARLLLLKQTAPAHYAEAFDRWFDALKTQQFLRRPACAT